jgi:hypothetical protein
MIMKRIHLLLLIAVFALPTNTHCQRWQWIRSQGGDQYGGAIRLNEGTGICTDTSGNVYAIGSFGGKAIFGKDTFISYMDISPVLIKYDSSENIIWARRLSHGATDFAYGICLDPQQNVCIVGDRSGSAIRSFVAKYSSDGRLLWELNASGEHIYTTTRAVASDKDGNFYVTGNCKGVTSFDSFTIGAENAYTIFLLKIDPRGNVLWVKHSQPSSEYYNEAWGIAIDKKGSIFITGEYTNATTFDKLRLTASGSDVFVAKYSGNGKVQWVKTWGSKAKDRPGNIAIDKRGNLYLTAYFSDTTKIKGKIIVGDNLLKLTPNGDFLWNRQVGVGAKDFYLRSFVAVDDSSYIYLTGHYYDAIPLLGEKTGSCKGAADIFIAKCTPAGEKIWKLNIGNTGQDEGKAICVDKHANIYVTGYFHGILNLEEGGLLLPPGEGDGMFVGKLR